MDATDDAGSREMTIGGRSVPSFFYGTAWKEEETERLVRLALEAGFRGIDTANQRRHYHEAGVGAALRAAFAEGLVQRDDLFLQTKFTYVRSQDHRLPYDPEAPFATQVEQSFSSSLEHLGVETIDSYVLHGPSTFDGLGEADLEVWGAMEALHAAGKTRFLGVSNVSLTQLSALCEAATTPPSFVQNRCFARFGWDAGVRAFCRDHGIAYQGFSLLTANRSELSQPAVTRIAEAHDRTVAQVVFRFALQVGMLSLTGTKNPSHMREDLAIYDFALSDDEVRSIESITG